MKAIEAIERADRLKPNAYSTEDKLAWLYRLDLQIATELHAAYEGESVLPDPAQAGAPDRALLVAAPWDELYDHYLAAQIDYFDRETEGFNASNAMFEASYGAYRNAFNREHRARSATKLYY
ncbi:MAG: hypothetical protein IK095_02180 [Oscillospiraceae bacterium]|nr:hypothetical protein [Oscillospiraceae bacterium]